VRSPTELTISSAGTSHSRWENIESSNSRKEPETGTGFYWLGSNANQTERLSLNQQSSICTTMTPVPAAGLLLWSCPMVTMTVSSHIGL
jgi:hypothetical protein